MPIRVDVHVELGTRRDVAPDVHGTAHHDDPPHAAQGPGIARVDERQVDERAEGDDDEPLPVTMRQID